MTQVASPESKPTGVAGRVIQWLDERAGAGGIWQAFFARKIPLGVGWFYTLGFVSLFVFTLQAATGIFLAVYYSPSPD